MNSEQTTSDTQLAAQFAIAHSLESQGKAAEALDHFERAFREFPQSREAREQYTRILTINFQTEMTNGRNQQACDFLLKISEAKASELAAHEIQSFLAFFKERGESKRALELLRNAMQFQNYFAEIHQELVREYLLLGRLDLAELEFQRYLARNEANRDCAAKTHVFIGFEGKFDLTSHQVQDLAAILEEQIVLLPSDEAIIDALQNFKAGNIARAEQLFRELLTQEPTNQAALLGHALSLEAFHDLSGNGSYLEHAIVTYQRTTELFPNFAYAWHRFGKGVNRLLSKYDFNLNCQKRAIELDPSIKPAYLEAGEMIFRSEGFISDGSAYITKYLQLLNRRIENHPIGKLGVRVLDWVNTYAFGHLATLPETYIKMVKLGWFGDVKKSIILAPPSMVANRALLECWQHHFDIITDRQTVYQLRPLARALTVDTAYFMHPNGSGHHLIATRSHVQKLWEDSNQAPILTTSEVDRQRGQKALREMGVPEGAWFACLHTREPGFKKEADAPYYRHCNVDATTYLAAVKAITARGGWVIRMGEPSMSQFPRVPQVIDYAHSTIKAEWLDVFLYMNARFFLASSTGAYGIVAAAGVPILFTNWSITLPLYEGKNDMFIYKMIHSTKENRLLTFKEIFSAPLFHRSEVHRMYDDGLNFIDNSPEEISDAVNEMLERLEGKVLLSPQDQALQQKFRDLTPKVVGPFSAHVGSAFLRKYAHLLNA